MGEGLKAADNLAAYDFVLAAVERVQSQLVTVYHVHDAQEGFRADVVGTNIEIFDLLDR